MLVYVRNGNVLVAEDKAQAKAVYGFEDNRVPDAELSAEKWEECAGVVRLIDGKLQYGYTEEELKEQHDAEVKSEIAELKEKLKATDYIAAKIAEGAATREEYSEQLEMRQEWRTRINELEEELLDVGSN